VTVGIYDSYAAVQAAIHNVTELGSSSIGGGLIKITFDRRQQRVDRDHRHWFCLRLLVDVSAMSTDLDSLTAVTLLRPQELYAAVAVSMVVPVDKRRDPLVGHALPCKWPSWVIRQVLRCAEQRYGVRFVIADARPRERPEHAQFFQPAYQRRRTHGIAVVSMQDQRLAAPLADLLSQAGSVHQIHSNGWILALGDTPGNDLAVPDADHHIEIQPYTSYRGRQVGDVPAPHLVWTRGPQSWNGSWFLWWPCSTLPVSLSVSVQHPVKTAFRSDISPRLARIGTIWPGGSAANSGSLQVIMIR